MTLSIVSEPVPLNADPDGVVRVAGTRVTLESVVQLYKEGASAEQIVEAYPILSLGDVYAVLGYYLRRKTDVEAYLQEQHTQADRVVAEAQSTGHLKGFGSGSRRAGWSEGDRRCSS